MKISYRKLLAAGKIRRHKTSKEEVSTLFGIIQRDIKDASIKELSPDRRYATAYNAALQAATILMHCHGYRTSGVGHHATTFMFMATLRDELEELAEYFDSCRAKRNKSDYDRAGQISEKEAEDLLKEVEEFAEQVKKWTKKNYPHLL